MRERAALVPSCVQRCDWVIYAVDSAGLWDTAFKASSKAPGSTLPRFSARRRMPEQAFALKKYRCGTSPVSKMSDNEDTAAALWYSGKLSVKHTPGDRVMSSKPNDEAAVFPAFVRDGYVHSGESVEEGSEGVSSVRRKYAGDVFPNDELWTASVSELDVLQGKVATGVGQAAALSGDTEGLAGCTTDEDVKVSIFFSLDGREVSRIRYVRIVVLQDGGGERLYLGKRYWRKSKRFPGNTRSFYAGANGQVSQCLSGLPTLLTGKLHGQVIVRALDDLKYQTTSMHAVDVA